MKRRAARAGQLSRASVASSALVAVHSPSHCTVAVDRRPDGRSVASALPLTPQRDACVIDGAALTRAVATRYVVPDRSTVITVMQTAFAGSGDTTTSSTWAAGSAAR